MPLQAAAAVTWASRAADASLREGSDWRTTQIFPQKDAAAESNGGDAAKARGVPRTAGGRGTNAGAPSRTAKRRRRGAFEGAKHSPAPTPLPTAGEPSACSRRDELEKAEEHEERDDHGREKKIPPENFSRKIQRTNDPIRSVQPFTPCLVARERSTARIFQKL